MTAAGIDRHTTRRRFERAAPTYSEVAVLAREVQRRMAERLDYLRHDPRLVLDAGCGPGEGLALLRMRYPRAALVGLDLARAMLRVARRGRTTFGRVRDAFSGAACHHVCGDIARLPLREASVDMVWSNLAFAWAGEPMTTFSELARVLAPGGLLMFSTYGPDTLKELRRAFSGVDAYPHVHGFVDMHDLGDMLMATQFADPVMDMEMVTLSYVDAAALVRDLRMSGQSNAEVSRKRGLMTPGAWTRMSDALESSRQGGRLSATFEIVYGHAWRAAESVADGDARVIKTDFARSRRR